MDNTRKVLTSQQFTDILVHGLWNQVAYVWQHFIDFVVYLIPMMKRLLEENEVLESFKEIISCLIGLLWKVDLSMYGEKGEEH